MFTGLGIDYLFESCRSGSLTTSILASVCEPISVRDDHGKSLLDVAIECNSYAMVDLLLKHISIPSTQDACMLLEAAARSGRCDIYQLIFNNLPDLDSSSCTSSMDIACTEGFSDIVTLIMSQFPLVVTGHHMLLACQHGHVDIIPPLLAAEVEPCAGEDDFDCIFIVSLLQHWGDTGNQVSDENKDTILKMLLEVGALTDLREDGIWRAAGGGGTVFFMKTLIETFNEEEMAMFDDEDMEPDDDTYFATVALASACEYARVDVIQYLFAFLENTDVAGCWDEFLRSASKNGHKDVFHMLLNLLKIDIHACDMRYDPDIVLLLAVACGCDDVVTALLSSGNCDINKVHSVPIYLANTVEHRYTKDPLYREAQLYWESQYNTVPSTVLAAASDPAVIKILLDNKAEVNPKDCVSVLATAAVKFQTVCVKMLLEAGADVNTGCTVALSDSSGCTESSTGCRSQHRFMSLVELVLSSPGQYYRSDDQVVLINLLLNAGLQTRDICGGTTALVMCTDMDIAPCPEPAMRALLTHDSGLLDAPGTDGLTPLLSSVQRGSCEVTKFLLRAGADACVCDRQGRTFLMLQVCRGTRNMDAHWSIIINSFINAALDAIPAGGYLASDDAEVDQVQYRYGYGVGELEQPRKRQRA